MYKILFFLISIIFFSESCKISYSFTGASISPEVKTIYIREFANNAPLIMPTLSQTATEALKDKFVTQTSLQLVDSEGDLNIECEITNYQTQPMAIQGNDAAALNRLTITIKVKFVNVTDEKQNFDTSISRFADYESSKSLDQVEDELIKQILSEINEDIFNKTVANW